MKNLIICSEQTVLVKKQISKTLEQLQTKYEDIETETLDFEELEFSQILVNVTTIPMFCEHKLYIIKNADFLTSKKHKILFDEKEFIAFIKDIPDFVTLIFVFNEKVDERKKMVKEMKKSFEIINFSEITHEKIDEVIMKKVQNYNLEISREDANYLAMQSNHNLSIINNDLEKIALYGDIKIIDKSVIDLHCIKTLESNVFSLTNHLFNNKKKSLTILEDLLSLKEEPLKLLIIISNQMRLLLQVKSYEIKGFTQQAITKQLKIHPYRVKLALENPLSLGQIKKHLVNLAEYDYKIKTGELNSKQAIEFFILNI